MALGVSFEKTTNINGAFYDGTVVLKFLRCSPYSVFIETVIGFASIVSKNHDPFGVLLPHREFVVVFSKETPKAMIARLSKA